MNEITNKKMDKKLPIIKLNGNIDIYSILKIQNNK